MKLNRVLSSFAAVAFAAITMIAADGSTSHLLASTGQCIQGGAGTICETRTAQECTNWTWSSFTIGTSVGFTNTCSRWETITKYYNWDTGSGGGSTQPVIKQQPN